MNVDSMVPAALGVLGALIFVGPVVFGVIALMQKRRKERRAPPQSDDARLRAIRERARAESPLDAGTNADSAQGGRDTQR